MSAVPKKWGGKQEGAGRPVGSIGEKSKMLREIAAKALAAGITPAEVMLDNMRFFHQKADVLQVAILDKVTRKGVLKGDEAMELLAEFKELGEFKMKAQSCAVDAAPYFHARLSAVTADVNVTHKVEEAEAAFKLIEGSLEAIITGEIIPAREKAKEKV